MSESKRMSYFPCTNNGFELQPDNGKARLSFFAALLVATLADLAVLVMLSLRVAEGSYLKFIVFPVLLVVLDVAFLAAFRFVNFRFRYSIAVWLGYVLATATFAVLSAIFPALDRSEVVITWLSIAVILAAQLTKSVAVTVAAVAFRNPKADPDAEDGRKKSNPCAINIVTLVLIAFVMVAYCGFTAVEGFMGQGIAVDSKQSTLVYSANSDGTYTVTAAMHDGDYAVIPERFNGKKVSAVDCALFNNVRLSKVTIEGKETVLTGFENALGGNPTLEISVNKDVLNDFRGSLYDNLSNAACIPLFNAVAPFGLSENEVCYNFECADLAVAKKLGVKYIPSVVKNKTESLSVHDIDVPAKFVGHNNVNSEADLYWSYCNSNSYMLLPPTVELTGKNIYNVEIKFERVLRLNYVAGNDTVYAYPASCVSGADGSTCGEYVAESMLAAAYDRLPSRDCFSVTWELAEAGFFSYASASSKAEFVSKLKDTTTNSINLKPVWTVVKPYVNGIYAHVDGTAAAKPAPISRFNFVYGNDIKLDSYYYTSAADYVVPETLTTTYKLYKGASLVDTNNTGVFALNGYAPAASGTYSVKAVASDATKSSLVSDTVVLDINLTIAKKTLRASFNMTETVFDGTAQEITWTPNTEDIVGSDVIGYSLSLESVTDAGSYDIVATLTGDSPELYTIASPRNNVTVLPKSVDAVWTSGVYVYNGEVQAPTAKATDVNGVAHDLTITDSGRDAGDYTAKASTFHSNYTVSNPTKEYSIARKTIGISSWSADTYVYNGSVQTRTVTALSDCVVGEESATLASLTYSGSIDSVNKGAAYSVSAALPAVTNYTLSSSVSADYAITAKPISLTWSENALVYSGDAQRPAATPVGVVAGDELGLSVAGAETDAGTGYTATASASNTNYSIVNPAKTFNVAAYSTAVIWDTSALVYNGAAQKPATSAVGVKGRAVSLSVSGEQVNAGTNYYAIATTADTNYTLTNATAYFDIAAKSVRVYWTNINLTFNGNSQKPDASAVGVLSENIPLSVSGEQINAGTSYGASASTTDTNYILTNYQTAFVINPYSSAVVWSDLSFEYDGTEHKPTASALDIDGAALTLSVSGGQTNAGSYSATATAADTNYVLTGKSTLFEISQVSKSVSWSNRTFMYDGAQHKPTATVYDINGTALPVTVYGAKSNFGEYTATASTSDNNYKLTDAETTFNVAARPVNVTLQNKTATYGDPEATLTASLTGGTFAIGDTLAGLNLNIVREPGNGVKAGGYAITATYVNDNYDVTFVDGTYTIAAREITVTLDDKTVTYGDPEAALTASLTGGTFAAGETLEVLNLNIVREAGNDVRTGGYAITATYVNDNYDVTFVYGTYTIAAREITVTLDDKTVTYGDPEAALTASLTGGTFAAGETLEVLNLNIVREAGNDVRTGGYAITATYLNDNYSVTFIEGVYTVTQKTVAVVWGSAELTYSGAAQAPSAEVVDGIVEADSVPVEVTGTQTEVGTGYTATASTTNGNYVISNPTFEFSIAEAGEIE